MIFGKDSEVTHELFTVIGLNQEFEIPAGSDHHVISTRLGDLPRNGELLSFAPHMHYRGKGFELFVNQAGRKSQLIDVPNYDFNWQHSYQLSKPIPLQDVDAFEFSFVFDNSVENPFNPDANQAVYWGDQTWEEMAVAFFDIARPRNSSPASSPLTAAGSDAPEKAREREARIRQFVDDFFRRFDQDGDGRIYRNELPNSLKHFGFRDFNSRQDGQADEFLDREEVRQAAAAIF